MTLVQCPVNQLVRDDSSSAGRISERVFGDERQHSQDGEIGDGQHRWVSTELESKNILLRTKHLSATWSSTAFYKLGSDFFPSQAEILFLVVTRADGCCLNWLTDLLRK